MTSRKRLAFWTLVILVWAVPLNILAAAPGSSPSSDRLWRLAAQEQAALDQRSAILHDESLSGYLQKIIGRLWARLHSELGPPSIKVVVDARMKAFAYPTGSIYLSTGMLSQIENESQLAMILAHEMVHYARQHTAVLYDRLQRTSPDTSLSRMQRSRFTGEDDTVAPEIDAAESVADEEGLSLLQDAGYCDAEVLTLMQNVLKNAQNLGLAETARGVQKRLGRIKLLLNNIPDGSACLSATDDGTSYLKKIAPALIADAQAAIQSGEWNQADRAISKYMVRMPDDARAFYLKGEILRRRNDGKSQNQCVGFYEKALEVDPQFPLAHRALGELYFKAGQYQMAKPHFEAFLSLAPQDDASAYIKGYMRLCQ